MRSSHWESCSAALCKDQEKTEAIWYPGEEICKGVPFTLFQKEQKRINRWKERGAKKYQNQNLFYTAAELTLMRQRRKHKHSEIRV